MNQGATSLKDYLDVVRRRKFSLIVPFAAIFLLSSAIAIILPPIYKSTSTILIEEQEIPADFVMATVTSFAEQRLQSIHQRIISTSRLLDIINRFRLYDDLKGKLTNEQIVSRMRRSIKLETISAEVVDRRTGRPSSATIAFTLTYEGKGVPEKVQRVANVLASLFLKENLQVRERQTKETYQFLEDEMKKLRLQLDEIEAKIAAFKGRHIDELPELFQVNLQSLESTERNIDRLNEQLRSLKEREGYLQTQLASLAPTDKMNEDMRRLRELRVELANLQTRFTDAYPDVIKTKQEIARLEEQIAADGGSSDGGRPDNPAYVTLASQLASTQADIESVKRQVGDLRRKANEYRLRIEASPKVEEGYKVLLIERNNTQMKFDDLMQKYMEAKVAHGLEKEQKGERFTLIDPARLPEKPYKPNRMAIILIGLILGVAAGVATVSVRELTDSSVRNAEALSMATQFPVLAGIPEIRTAGDLRRRRRMRLVKIAALILICVCGLVVVHFWVMDLHIFWARLMRRLAM
ncbi:MAG: chain-length determining protein [Deltaproteobacteria bacterium SG8_13]|nr:MAG: chain-length determining protein [Deltaproteobacteria bacterium SG8_13]